MRKIGVLGGTFNPPHLGHLILAQEALEQLGLAKVIFVPARIPPHKTVKDDSARCRYRMTALCCRGNPSFEVSDIELKRKTVSYSVDTLLSLQKRYGKRAKLFFITGSDSLPELESWKNISRIMRLATFVVAARPGFPPVKLKRKVKLIEIPAVQISSSDIRRRVRLSRSARYLVSDPVRSYINKHRLYR